MVRLLAAVVLVQMALAGAGPHLVRALGEERHVCVCPIDADGDCRCFDCIRLGVHGERDAHDHDERAPSGPIWASGCTGGSDTPTLVTFEPVTPAPEGRAASPPHPVSVSPFPQAGEPASPDLRRLDRPPRAA